MATQTVTLTTATPCVIDHFEEQIPVDATFDSTKTQVVTADPTKTLTCRPFIFVFNDDPLWPAGDDATTDVALYSISFKEDPTGTTTHTFTCDADRVVVESDNKRPFTTPVTSRAAYLWLSKNSKRFPG
jgi:hypothetical protein